MEGGEAVVRPPAEVGGEEGVVVQQGVELGGQEGGVRVVEGVNIGVGGQQCGVVSTPEHHGNLDTMIMIIIRKPIREKFSTPSTKPNMHLNQS